MRKQTNKAEPINPKYLSRKEFSKYLGLGLNKTMEVAQAAGAVVYCGSRTLIDIDKFNKYSEGRTQLL